MTDVTRDEFDKLAERVTRIERSLGATIEIVAAEVVGLRTYLDDRFAAVDGRFDAVDAKLDRYTEQVNAAIHAGTVAADRSDRFMRAIADHFDIELD